MGSDSLRVSTGAKRIEVNDEGEYITLNLGDQSFLPRLSAVIDGFNAKMPEYEAHARELDALHKTVSEIKAMPNGTEEEKAKKFFAEFDRIKDLTIFNEKIHRDLMVEIDGAFRDEVCRKVFGNIVPSMDMFQEFFEALSPYIEKFGRERAAKVSKYSAERVGNG